MGENVYPDRGRGSDENNNLPSRNSALDWVINELCEFLERVRGLQDPQRCEHVWKCVEAHIETKYPQHQEFVSENTEEDDEEIIDFFCLRKSCPRFSWGVGKKKSVFAKALAGPISSDRQEGFFRRMRVQGEGWNGRSECLCYQLPSHVGCL